MILKIRGEKSAWTYWDNIRSIRKIKGIIPKDAECMQAIEYSFVKRADGTGIDEVRLESINIDALWISQRPKEAFEEAYGSILELIFIAGDRRAYFVQEAYIMNDKGVTIEAL